MRAWWLLLLCVASPALAKPPPVERTVCAIAAARRHGIPPVVMLAVADNEGGRPGQANRNKNGTYDIGAMQINTRYLSELQRRYGIQAKDVAAAGCYPYLVAASRVRRHIDTATGDPWSAVANYHSRTARRNQIYRGRLLKHAAKWVPWLKARGITTPRRWLPRNSHQENTRPPTARRRPSKAAPLTPTVQVVTPQEPSFLDLLEPSSPTYVSVAAGPSQAASESIGSAHNGHLANGIQASNGPGYRLRDRGRAWGTAETLRWLNSGFRAVLRHFPRSPTVMVHDISHQHGGRMGGHKSHQSGRDVDIMYYQRSCRDDVCRIGKVSPANLDAKRQWRMLESWVKQDRAEFVFVDYSLQEPLYRAAKAAGASRAELSAWFQWPRGATASAGIIRHVPNHADHLHVRFACPKDDNRCKAMRVRNPAGEFVLVEAAADWLDLLKEEQEEDSYLDLLQ